MDKCPSTETAASVNALNPGNTYSHHTLSYLSPAIYSHTTSHSHARLAFSQFRSTIRSHTIECPSPWLYVSHSWLHGQIGDDLRDRLCQHYRQVLFPRWIGGWPSHTHIHRYRFNQHCHSSARCTLAIPPLTCVCVQTSIAEMTPLTAYNNGLCNYVYRTKAIANRSPLTPLLIHPPSTHHSMCALSGPVMCVCLFSDVSSAMSQWLSRLDSSFQTNLSSSSPRCVSGVISREGV